MDKDYYTVGELANYLNISRQAIYQRIKKDLAKYVKKDDNGRTLLDKTIINEFTIYEQALDQELEIVELKERVKGQEALINSLTSQVNNLTNILTVQTNNYNEINNKLLQLLEQNNELNKNNQILLAQLQQKESEPSADSLIEEVVTPTKPKRLFSFFKK